MANLIDEQSAKWKESVVNTTFNKHKYRLSDRLRWCLEKIREPTVQALLLSRNKLLHECKRKSSSELCTFVMGYIIELEILEDTQLRSVTNQTGMRGLEASILSIIIKDKKGLIMGVACNWNRNILSVEAVKALVAVQAIRFVQEMGFQKVEFEGNSLVIISKIKMQGINRSKGGNQVAHLLAKAGFIQKRDVQWVEDSLAIREIMVVEERNLFRTK
ncbi:hypothetical protein CXB51_019898 [Gossypium anomalum]|uniref:RNase H type-1 domain-containing protein n=1 Tax=Gossypium anomalum TaxID=47600 RepID=A0A8J6CVT4_9ROSI|nr:hypothetical protein CXB51_019898 [Gossypium anomalum]